MQTFLFAPDNWHDPQIANLARWYSSASEDRRESPFYFPLGHTRRSCVASRLVRRRHVLLRPVFVAVSVCERFQSFCFPGSCSFVQRHNVGASFRSLKQFISKYRWNSGRELLKNAPDFLQCLGLELRWRVGLSFHTGCSRIKFESERVWWRSHGVQLGRLLGRREQPRGPERWRGPKCRKLGRPGHPDFAGVSTQCADDAGNTRLARGAGVRAAQ